MPNSVPTGLLSETEMLSVYKWKTQQEPTDIDMLFSSEPKSPGQLLTPLQVYRLRKRWSENVRGRREDRSQQQQRINNFNYLRQLAAHAGIAPTDAGAEAIRAHLQQWQNEGNVGGIEVDGPSVAKPSTSSTH